MQSEEAKALRAGQWDEFLRQVKPTKPLDFAGQDWCGVKLVGLTFPTRAIFDGCIFDNDRIAVHVPAGASFKKAKFTKPTSLEFFTVNDHTINFRKAVFEGPLTLVELRGASEVKFTDATFNDGIVCKADPRLNSTWPALSLADAKVKGSIYISAVPFANGRFCRLKVAGPAWFENCSFISGANFEGAEFESDVSFENVKFLGSSSFRSTLFNVAPNFHNSELHAGTQFSLAHDFPKNFPDIDSVNAPERYRTLKLAMNKQHALSEEAGFFLLEMRARATHEPVYRRVLYQLYDVLSNYGQSVRRPALWFFGVNVGFGFAYSYMAGRGWGAFDPQLLALTLFGAIPFAAALRWPEVTPTHASLFPSSMVELAQVAIVVQSVVSALLLFLIGLGLRNMFKIK